MFNYSKQTITNDDILAVTEVLTSDYLTQGPKITQFEKVICDYIGAPYCAVVNSATSALHTISVALGLNSQSTVWVPGISFVATANCVEYCSAKLQFLDVDPKTGNLDLLALETKLKLSEITGTLPDVVIAVDIGGRPCPLTELIHLSNKFNFHIIHDASHSFGSEHNHQKVGSHEDITATIFSFHAVKPITTGEGGAICLHNEHLHRKCKQISSHSITRDNQPDPWMYDQIGLGYNYRITELQAALGISQVKKSDYFISQKTAFSKIYDQRLAKHIEYFQTPTSLRVGDKSALHLYQIRIDQGPQKRREMYDALKNKGIISNVHYRPIYQNSYYKAKYGVINLVGCELFYSQVLALPMHPSLNLSDIDEITHKIDEVCNDIF